MILSAIASICLPYLSFIGIGIANINAVTIAKQVTAIKKLTHLPMSEELDPTSQRIKILIDEFAGGVQLRFAKLVGTSQTSIHELFGKRQNKPGLLLVKKILTALPQLRTEWLIAGQGDMLKSVNSDAEAQKFPPYPANWQSPESKIDTVTISPPYQNARRIPAESISLKVLPYLPFRARATFAESFTDDLHKYNWEKADSIAVTDVPDTSEFKEGLVVEVEGDSMETTLRNGSKVLVTPVQQSNWQYMSSGIYCIVYNDSFVVKRVKSNTLLENGLLTLHSDNPEAGSFPVRGNDIRAVWRVRWAVYVPL